MIDEHVAGVSGASRRAPTDPSLVPCGRACACGGSGAYYDSTSDYYELHGPDYGVPCIVQFYW